MANGGWYGTREEWENAEAPLLPMDKAFEEFARRNDFSLTKNGKDWPERSLRRISNNVDCLIQIYAESLEHHTFNFWVCASQDRANIRYWKQKMLKRNSTAHEIRSELGGLLTASMDLLDIWCSRPEDLEFAIKLSPEPKRS